MSTETTNYRLEKPSADEFYDIGVHNNNSDIIDGQMKKNADEAKKANESLTLHSSDKVSHITSAERENWNDAKKKLDGIAEKATANSPSTTTPKANGTAAAGSESEYARGDHVHPLQTSVSGNAGTSDKWTTARKINGMSVQGDADRANYGSCSTAAATAAKVVACTGFALATGSEITVKFTVTNTAANPTLNVNGTGAKPIYYRGAAIAAGYLAANRTYTFRYNGTQYELVGDLDTNTTYSAATQSANGLMSAADKKKLDGVSEGANAYTHPATSGNKHIPSGGSSGQILRWSADGTAAWGNDNNTTYSPATQSANGLMSAADKKKLDGVSEGANAYTHPNSGATAGTYRSVTVNAQGHVTGGSNPTVTVAQGGTGATTAEQARTNLGAAAASHTHSYAGSSSAGGTATKALGDSDGAQINTTYRKKSEGSIVKIQASAPTDTTALWVS